MLLLQLWWSSVFTSVQSCFSHPLQILFPKAIPNKPPACKSQSLRGCFLEILGKVPFFFSLVPWGVMHFHPFMYQTCPGKQSNNSFMLQCKCKYKNLLFQRYLHFNGHQTLRKKQQTTCMEFQAIELVGCFWVSERRCLWNVTPHVVSRCWGCFLHRSQWLAWPCNGLCIWEQKPFSRGHVGGETLSLFSTSISLAFTVGTIQISCLLEIRLFSR